MGNSGTTAKAAADEDQTRSKSVDCRPGRKRRLMRKNPIRREKAIPLLSVELLRSSPPGTKGA